MVGDMIDIASCKDQLNYGKYLCTLVILCHEICNEVGQLRVHCPLVALCIGTQIIG